MRRFASWRIAAGAVVLACLIGFLGLLVPSYLRNREFQNFLDRTVNSELAHRMPPGALQASVADGAGRIGLPVAPDQVRVRQTADDLRIEVRYAVRVEIPLYTVDLHFRPAAVSRRQ
ncbi:MAG TPA: hypothetical protein VFQ79_22770 [Bryobacteraceae bacterium]|nr:hypothetical protein [Bryobacteraceae bacterium]